MGWLAPYSGLAHHCSDKGTGFPTGLCLVLSCKKGQLHFAAGYATPGLGCLWNVDCLGVCHFTMGYLPYSGIVMTCMYESLVELPAQTMMGQITVIKHMLSGARGLLPYLHQFMSAPIPQGHSVGRAYLESGSP
jgi:hypothetical protein